MGEFQRDLAEFDARKTQIIAFSVDSVEDARESIENLGLTFPVGFGLDHIAFAQATGAFYEERRSTIQATEFILKGDGTLLGSLYSSGPAGRYDSKAVLRILDAVISRT